MRGTLLNSATVAAGATAGLLVGAAIPATYQDVALHGLGLVTLGMGIKMFIAGRNPLIAALAVAFGGVIGLALGLHSGIESIAHLAQARLGQGASSRFSEGMVTSFVVFCIGPMTLLGCIQDGLEGKIELLGLKSTMDGVAAIFLAAASGAGVLVTALLLFLFQGGLTLLARPLRPLAADEAALAETTATGGAILLATGIGLLGIKDLHTADYLPAIFLAPAFVFGARRFAKPSGVAA